ncbi:MAG: hypothetical protein R2799_15700 [Crocinitomicaceae bacterium]
MNLTSPSKNKIVVQYIRARDLSKNEIEELEKLVHEVDPSLPENHVQKNHLERYEGDFYLIRMNEELVAAVSYSCIWVQDKKSKRKVLVSIGELAYRKNRKEIKKVVGQISFKHIKRQLGVFWMFKKFAAIAITVNPRVYVQFNSFFPVVHPQLNENTPSTTRSFLKDLLFQHYGSSPKLTEKLVVESNSIFVNRTDVSDKYESYFKTKDALINDFFVFNGVHLKEGNTSQISNKSVLIMGYYSPVGYLKKKLGMSTKNPELECIPKK